MILCISAETTIPDLVIDFIEVRLKTGETVSLTWDESESGVEEGLFDARYKGVYFGEEHANGRIDELEDMQVEYVELYSESDLPGTFRIREMVFEDDMELLRLDVPIYEAERSSHEKTHRQAG